MKIYPDYFEIVKYESWCITTEAYFFEGERGPSISLKKIGVCITNWVLSTPREKCETPDWLVTLDWRQHCHSSGRVIFVLIPITVSSGVASAIVVGTGQICWPWLPVEVESSGCVSFFSTPCHSLYLHNGRALVRPLSLDNFPTYTFVHYTLTSSLFHWTGARDKLIIVTCIVIK